MWHPRQQQVLDTSLVLAAEPFAGLSWVRVATDAFREIGGAAALVGAAEHEQAGFSTVGIRAVARITLGDTVVVPRATLAWQHAFSNLTPTAGLAFINTAAAFGIAGVPLARDTALVEGGFDIIVRPNATVGVAYSGELAKSVTDHAIKGRATVRF